MPAQPKETLEKILETLGFTATIEEHKLEEGLLLEVKTEDAGRLIGRQGQTLPTCNTSPTGCCFNRTPPRPK